MTRFDDILEKDTYSKVKPKKQVLTLALEEGDDVINSIKQGMEDNGVKSATVEDVSGKLKEASISCMDSNKFKRIDFVDTEILRASGLFKISAGDLWGSLNIFTAGRKPMSGKMIRGKASDGFTIKLSFTP